MLEQELEGWILDSLEVAYDAAAAKLEFVLLSTRAQITRSLQLLRCCIQIGRAYATAEPKQPFIDLDRGRPF